MFSAIDARGPGLQPRRDNSVVACLYFISFMVVYSFCCLNLFVGVTLDNFTRRSQQMGLEAGILLTKEQRVRLPYLSSKRAVRIQKWLFAKTGICQAESQNSCQNCSSSPARVVLVDEEEVGAVK